MVSRKSNDVWQFGDFQTPDELALQVTQLLQQLGIVPNCILEPTCGKGSFLMAAAYAFPQAERLIGIDINLGHLSEAKEQLKETPGAARVSIQQGDFFKVNWNEILGNGQDRWLILGNPPWVTSSELGALNSENLPGKSNFHGRTGIEAMTGKSNFDISEWMLLRYLDWLRERVGTIAVLCKTAVARKILAQAWKEDYSVKAARIYMIDAMKHFGASVDACLFVLETSPGFDSHTCDVFSSISDTQSEYQMGFYNESLIADVDGYLKHRNLYGVERNYKWRSGIKHDCSKVMELVDDNGQLRNGLGEVVELENTCLFPMFKSSDISNGRSRVRGVMLVPQRSVGEDTARIENLAPKTWRYLTAHAALLNKRGSSIYRNRPQFSIFGVGEYSFAPWKVAISGFYKKLRFAKIGEIQGRPAVFDDTVYFLPCYSEDEADFLCELLSSDAAHDFYNSMIFWSDKRPITIDLLKRLNLRELACEMGKSALYERFTTRTYEK